MKKVIVLVFVCIASVMGQMVSLSGKVTSSAGGPIEGALVKLAGTEYVALTDAQGQYKISAMVSVNPRMNMKGDVRISFNHPTLYMESVSDQNVRVELFDPSGKIAGTVFSGPIKKGRNPISINHPLKSGIYFLKVSGASQSSVYAVHSDGNASFRVSNHHSEKVNAIAKVSASNWLGFSKKGYVGVNIPINGNSGEYNAVLGAPSAIEPNFGPNVKIFTPGMASGTIQSRIDSIAVLQDDRQYEFAKNRWAFFFKPGTYNVNAYAGYYVQIAGLGLMPSEVNILGGVESREVRATSLSNFWRSAENITVTPTAGTNYWVASQAAPFRRMHVKGGLSLSKGGYTSGGFIANSIIDKTVSSGTQQQYFSRNASWGAWSGGVWNMFFLGVVKPPVGAWPSKPYTTISSTPKVREKPFVFIDSSGRYNVFVPSWRENSNGVSWANGNEPGEIRSIDQFYLARQNTDNAATINTALAQGKDILFTPGIYNLDESLLVTRPGTVMLGLGFASLVATAGNVAMTIRDVEGVVVAGITFDAGPITSPTLLMVGESTNSMDRQANPVMLSDIFCRVGTDIAGSAKSCLTINSNGVIADHLWLWRADHGPSATAGRPGWAVNTSANGLIVNGNDVTLYGLFNEHFQEFQTLWNGNGGRTYFFQCEIPYDIPNQPAWSFNGADGYAAYKVSDRVTSHEAWGLGIYNTFQASAVWAENAIEVPKSANVRMHNMRTRYLSGLGGGQRHIINGVGSAATSTTPDAILVEYP